MNERQMLPNIYKFDFVFLLKGVNISKCWIWEPGCVDNVCSNWHRALILSTKIWNLLDRRPDFLWYSLSSLTYFLPVSFSAAFQLESQVHNTSFVLVYIQWNRISGFFVHWAVSSNVRSPSVCPSLCKLHTFWLLF